MTQKRCLPTGKAKGFKSCNNYVDRYKYGMCEKCFKIWLKTPEGIEYAFSLIPRAKKQVQKEIKQKDRKQKQELNSTAAMKLADTYFSRYIRLYNSIEGQCTCYTCGTIKHIKEIDNGHYIKREHKTTRYSEINCRPQCKTCNGDTKHNGKQVEFRLNLVNELGLCTVEELEHLGKQSVQANALFYRNIADEYRIKVNELQLKLGVKYW